MTKHIGGGRYRLEKRIGAGGMGEVWLAYDLRLHRLVAAKRASKNGPALSLDEARYAARLHHPNVVTIFDAFEEDDRYWLIMEFVPAPNLHRLIVEHGPMSTARAASIGGQLADGLAAVHRLGFVHCDVKPGNVLVTADGVAKLTDFGISRNRDGDTTPGGAQSPGTPGFMAPEVANGRRPSPASDVFSLGATLYAAVEGVSPYGDSDAAAMERRAKAGMIIPPTRRTILTPVLDAMLRINPPGRPSADAARRRLLGVTQHHRPAALAGVAGVALVVMLALLIGVRADAVPGPGRKAASSSPSLGDVRGADPCALLDPDALRRFGATSLDPAYGNFDRCDVLLNEGGDDETDVRAEFDLASSDERPPASQTHRLGALTLVRHPADGDECDRLVLLPGGENLVAITAQRDDADGTELCPLADVATDTVLAVLRRGTVPRRAAPPAASLARVDACGLLDAAALAGIHAGAADPGFARWACHWSSTTSDLDVALRFDQGPPLSGGDGELVRLGGRRALVEPGGDGDDTCVVHLEHLRFRDTVDDLTTEQVYLSVEGRGATTTLCHTATALARAAADRLPPL